MTNLSQRVQESKKLEFNPINTSYHSASYGTTTHGNMHHYQINLDKMRETSQVGDKEIGHDTIKVECIKCHQPVGNCNGNSFHTICRHGIGAIRHHLDSKDYTIAFCEDIFDAIKLRRNGQTLVKVISAQGKAILWGVVEEKKMKFDKRVELMRGTEVEQNGID